MRTVKICEVPPGGEPSWARTALLGLVFPLHGKEDPLGACYFVSKADARAVVKKALDKIKMAQAISYWDIQWKNEPRVPIAFPAIICEVIEIPDPKEEHTHA